MISYRRFVPSDEPFHDELMRQAFGTVAARNAELRDRNGIAAIRIAEIDGRPAGALSRVPCGQFYGGLSVPATFVAGVAVAPVWRGKGAGGALLTALLRELFDEGIALCALYASNLPLYRKVGFEVTGTRHLYEVSLSALVRSQPAGLALTRIAVDDFDPTAPLPASLGWLDECYRRSVHMGAGALDRSAFFWREKLLPPARDVDLYALDGHGYVAVRHAKSEPLQLMDWCAEGPQGQAILMWFLAGQRANWSTARLYGSPFEPLGLAVRDEGWNLAAMTPWLSRIVDVRGALATRGYGAHLAQTLSLAVTDPVLSENHSGFRLTIAGGAAKVERCPAESCELHLDIGALAPLYSGLASPWQLARAGRLSGDAAALAGAHAVFAGPPPHLMDTF